MKKKTNNKLGKTVKVQWADAAGEQKTDKCDIDNSEPKDLLVITDTFGILYKEDELAVVILQEDSKDSVDYTVIPKGMILSINELK